MSEVHKTAEEIEANNFKDIMRAVLAISVPEAVCLCHKTPKPDCKHLKEWMGGQKALCTLAICFCQPINPYMLNENCPVHGWKDWESK